jgi:glycosyltransferase involved in cell wall biosynthesis
VARLRGLPLVATVHGGVLDLPESVKEKLVKPLEGGLEWGKIFGLLFGSRRLLEQADAIITCNSREAALLQSRYPRQRIEVHPHSVPVEHYRASQTVSVLREFPVLQNKALVLIAGRMDPVKNQLWVVEQWPAVLTRHPQAMLVLAGACTDQTYGKALKKEIRNLGLEDHVLMTGGLPPGDARLIGLFQEAAVVVVPSLSETFGLVILEAWAAGTAVISTRTSGAASLIREGENGWFFEEGSPESFHAALAVALDHPEICAQFAKAGHELVRADYNAARVAERTGNLYRELVQQQGRK